MITSDPLSNVVYCVLLCPVFFSPFVLAAIFRSSIRKSQYWTMAWAAYLGITMLVCIILQSQLCGVGAGTPTQQVSHRNLFAIVFCTECLLAIFAMLGMYLIINRQPSN
jgi:hypothetical protein